MSEPIVSYDRVVETTTTTGTGTVTLAGAKTGYRAFSAVVVGTSMYVYYTIVSGTEWEVGTGIYTLSGTTLARSKVHASSNSGSKVNFSSGSKDVFITGAANLLNRRITTTLGYKNLILQNYSGSTTTSVSITADEVVMQDSNRRTICTNEYLLSPIHDDGSTTLYNSGRLAYITQSGASGLDSGAEGSSTWYFIWAIRKEVMYYRESVTITNGTDIVNLTGHGLTAGTPIVFGWVSQPAGLTASTTYYVRDVTTDTFKVATTPGGTAVNITSDGSGVEISELPALILSASATSLSKPTNYIYAALLGAVYNNGSSNFNTFYQLNNRVWVAQTNVFDDQTGVVSWTSQSISTIVPSTAKVLLGVVGASANSARGIAIAGDSSGVGLTISNAASSTIDFLNYTGHACGFIIPLITAQTFYWQSSNTSAFYRVDISGWEY